MAQVTGTKGSGCCAGQSKAKNVAQVQSKSYVAFGCDKTDRIARAAARAYVAMMIELKQVAGGQGCSDQACTEVLAVVLADRNEQRDAIAETEVVVTPVSLSAVSEKAVSPKSACRGSGK